MDVEANIGNSRSERSHTSRPTLRSFSAVKDLVLKTFESFGADNVPLLSAAFSFYAVLSMSPLLVLAVVGGSLYFGGHLSAQAALLREITTALGPQVGALFQDVMKGASQGPRTIATLLSIAIAVFAGSNLFLQLDQAVRIIWKIQVQGPFIKSFVRMRLSALAGMFTFGIATFTWLIFDSWLFWLEHGKYSQRFTGWSSVSLLASVVFLFLFFMIVLRTLPAHRTKWPDVWPGALVVALGIGLGKLVLNSYFSHAHLSAAYGSAGSIVIILLWVYYTSQIYFFGVELTYQYAHKYGSLAGKEGELQHS